MEAMDSETRPRRYPRSRTCPFAIEQKEAEPLGGGAVSVRLTVWYLRVRADAYVLAVPWEKGKITDAQFVDGLTEQLIELELSTRFRLPFAQVAMLIQQACRTPDNICKHVRASFHRHPRAQHLRPWLQTW